MKKIILASQSERRYALFSTLDLPFSVKASQVDEDKNQDLSIEQLVLDLARRKAEAVAATITKPTVVIGADTLITFGGEVIGKPLDDSDALRILEKLNGQTHQVYTGVHLIETPSAKSLSRVVMTEVTFKQVSREQLLAYVESGEPLDKAGAYGIQSRGIFLLDSLNGDFTNVVGLPLPTLIEMLAEFEIPLFS